MFVYEMRDGGGPDVSEAEIHRQLRFMTAFDLAQIDEDSVIAIVAETFGFKGDSVWDDAWEKLETMDSEELYAIPGVDRLVDDVLIERILDERYDRRHDAEPFDYED